MKIELGRAGDIDDWMRLVDQVKESFPGLETKAALEEHRNTVLEFMREGSAICAKSEDMIVGTLLFSPERNMLCFLAVDATYRRQHVAERMVSYMLTFMAPPKKTLWLRRTGRECRRGSQPERFTSVWGLPRGSCARSLEARSNNLY